MCPCFDVFLFRCVHLRSVLCVPVSVCPSPVVSTKGQSFLSPFLCVLVPLCSLKSVLYVPDSVFPRDAPTKDKLVLNKSNLGRDTLRLFLELM